MMSRAALLMLALLAAAPAHAELRGMARAIDGDTLAIGPARIRLAGIDAPERRQQCWAPAGVWSCGRIAAAALAALIDGRAVACAEAGRDRWRRVLARCTADGVEINRALVAGGWALAYRAFSSAYAADEDAARQAARGVWGSSFLPPWTWRRR